MNMALSSLVGESRNDAEGVKYFFFSFQGSGPQYQPPNILLTFLEQSVELFRIQIKTQTFLYYFFLLQQILKCFGAALLFDFFEFQIWSCQKLSQRFFCLST